MEPTEPSKSSQTSKFAGPGESPATGAHQYQKSDRPNKLSPFAAKGKLISKKGRGKSPPSEFGEHHPAACHRQDNPSSLQQEQNPPLPLGFIKDASPTTILNQPPPKQLKNTPLNLLSTSFQQPAQEAHRVEDSDINSFLPVRPQARGLLAGHQIQRVELTCCRCELTFYDSVGARPHRWHSTCANCKHSYCENCVFVFCHEDGSIDEWTGDGKGKGREKEKKDGGNGGQLTLWPHTV